jgi:hypothetical protein
MAKLEYDMNNIRLSYMGYEISIAQHSAVRGQGYDPQTISERNMYVEEIAVKTKDGWEVVYYPAPNDADDYIVGIQAAKKFIDTLHYRHATLV